jgi:hypothetical protein
MLIDGHIKPVKCLFKGQKEVLLIQMTGLIVHSRSDLPN